MLWTDKSFSLCWGTCVCVCEKWWGASLTLRQAVYKSALTLTFCLQRASSYIRSERLGSWQVFLSMCIALHMGMTFKVPRNGPELLKPLLCSLDFLLQFFVQPLVCPNYYHYLRQSENCCSLLSTNALGIELLICSKLWLKKNHLKGPPWWSSGKRPSTSNAAGCGLDPLVGELRSHTCHVVQPNNSGSWRVLEWNAECDKRI